MATTRLSRGAQAIVDALALDVPRRAVTVGYVRREWIVYVLDRACNARVRRAVADLERAGTPDGLPVRVVYSGPVRPLGGG